VNVLHDGEDVVIVLLGLRTLGTMPAVLNLQLVQFEPPRQFIQFRRSRIGNIKPRQIRNLRIHLGQF